MTVTPPPPYQPPASAPHRPPPAVRRWRWAAVGAAAGAALAVSVAIPLTWAARQETTWADAEAQQSPSDDDRSATDQLPWRGGRAELAPSDTSGTGATAEESAGVVLVDTVLPGGEGAGTGLVLSDDGLVLTNYHVVDGASEITATVAATGDSYSATVLGYDEEADVALVRLDDASGLDEARLDDDGDDDELGDPVTAVGNAGGQGSLSTVDGTIVATEQDITTEEPHGESLTGLLETDAAAVGGYSGGPMLDDEGEVVGVTTAASSGRAGASYAVPIDDALEVVEQVESGDESGSVHIGPPAYLGVSVTDQGGASGALVAEVTDDGPAADAGLAAGDRITGIDGTAVDAVDDLLAALEQQEPGDSVTITWVRNGSEHDATVGLDASPYA